MTAREILENEMARVYNERQLDMMIRAILKQSFEYFVARDRLPIMITGFINGLEKDQVALKDFISQLIVSGPSLEIRGAAKAYLDDILGIQTPVANPYKDLIVLGQPFADRQSFRDKLKDLLALQYNRTLAANGPRYSGRSHSRILVRHVGQKIGIGVAFVDLLRTDLRDAINDLINEMQLDVQNMKDRMGQYSNLAKGFITTLRGISQNQFVQNNTRWCIVFDHHDLAETPPERKEFAEMMIQELMENTLPNIYVVMLGLGSCQYLPQSYVANIMNVDLLRLGITDLETYVNDLHVLKNMPRLDRNAMDKEMEKVLADLTLPIMTVEGMSTMSQRLRQYF